MKTSKFMITAFLLLALPALVACGNNSSGKAAPLEVKTGNKAAEAAQQELKIRVGQHVLKAALVDNSSTRALVEKLKQGPVTIHMHDFSNFEKVGDLGFSLPANDEHITTVPGDLILYQGRRFVIYYDTNTWDFTRMGKLKDVNQAQLKEILGKDDVTVQLEL